MKDGNIEAKTQTNGISADATLTNQNNLGNTNDFLSKLKQLCQIDKDSHISKKDGEWILILIDCDDVGALLNSEKISMIDAQNSINLLNASISKLIKRSRNSNDNDNEIFGYHLGSDLFALFVCDNTNKMSKSIEIAEYLLKVMQNKKESSFTISVGIGIRQIEDNVDKTQREWVLRAHINLLRAKENGKNCYFNNQNKIDPCKDNKDLTTLIQQANKLYSEKDFEKLENLLNDILNMFDEDIIVRQTITTKNSNNQCTRSIHLMKAAMLVFWKSHIGNAKYREYKTDEWMRLCMTTFILGNMSIECYYHYKVLQVEIERDISPRKQYERKTLSQQAQDRENHDNDLEIVTKKYDLTLLTRKHSANPVVSAAAVMKGTSLYYAKHAFEHLDDISNGLNITLTFGKKIGVLGKKTHDYQHQLFQQVIKCDPNYSVAKKAISKCLWDMTKYDESLDFINNSLKAKPNDVLLLIAATTRYFFSCHNRIDTKMKNIQGLTKDERINKAIEYGQKLFNLAHKDRKWIKKEVYSFYAVLIYAWSKEFDKNRQQQVTALKMYEKCIKMDQQFGYDIINNWIRGLDKFEHGLVNTIIEYWYLPRRSMHRHILDYVDLIHTYFNQDSTKMNHAKILSSIAPHGYFYKRRGKIKNPTQQWLYISVKKYSLYHRAGLKGGQTSSLRNVVASWYSDVGGASTNEINSNESKIEFSASFAAKLAYFFAFWDNYNNFILNELKLTIDLIKKIRIVMIKLLIHYVFKLEKQKHRNTMAMIQDSTIVKNMVNTLDGFLSLTEFVTICEAIEQKICVKDEKVILNMATSTTPFIVTKDQR